MKIVKKYLIWLLLILLVIVRYITTRPVYGNGDTVRITATIYSDPVEYPGTQYIRIAGLKAYLTSYPEISYGDRMIVEGVVKDGKLEKPKLVSVVERGTILSLFRNKIIRFYQESLPQPMSGLLAGIVLGAKGALSQDFYDATKLTGVAHVVVASGTNVTFVVSFLTSVIFVFLPRRKAIPFVILGIILYLFVSGFDAPLIRAAVMSGTVFLAQETGKLVNAWRILFLTALVMLVINPQWAIDIGFLLSFASVASIMFFQPRLKKFFDKGPTFLATVLGGDFATTISAQIGVSPILFVTFGQFNILSPVINLLVLWTIPPLMIIGAVGGMVGLIAPFLGKVILYLGYPLLWWFTTVVSIFS